MTRLATATAVAGISFSVGQLGSAGAADGGLGTPAAPVAKDVRCSERCLDTRTVTETGRAEITGKNLDGVTTVKLGDDRLRARKVSATRVEFVVPEGARSARPKVIDDFGSGSRAPEKLVVKSAKALSEVDGFNVRKAEAVNRKSFFSSKRKSKLEYLFEAEGPTDIRIDVLSGKRGKTVDSIVKRNQEPFQSHTATWNGLTEKGKVADSGRYKFKVSQLSGGPSSGAGFNYYNHIFPLKGKHTYGDGIGAGRNHMGQDIFARCGNKIVAARGGKVKSSGYQSSAGYYVVIDGSRSSADYAYYHMEKKGRPKQGSRVRTGERIGFNSDTGNASGCHVHFELWSAPGWYAGGSIIDPTPLLKRWDKWS